jgi:toxin FitB
VLIDTNVWSELSRNQPDERVIGWMRANFDSCLLSALVLAEIRYGIELSEGTRRRELMDFLDDLLWRLADKVINFDAVAAGAWAPLRAELKRTGNLICERDMLIAAHAISLGVPLVTRNVAEMRRTGASIINLWEA